MSPSTTTATNSAAYATPSTGSSEGAKRRGKSPGQKKKGSKRASSALGTPRRKTQNPIEDDLIFRIGTSSHYRKYKMSSVHFRTFLGLNLRFLQDRRGGIKESSPTCKEWLLPPVAGY